jgi:hypothetical protein
MRVLAASPRAISGSLVTTGNFQQGGVMGARYNVFVSEARAKTSSMFEGAAPNGTPILPIKAGGMSSRKAILNVGSGASSLLSGGPMEGTGAVLDFADSPASLALNVALNGTSAVATLTGNSMVLRLTVGLDGTGEFSLTGTNNLAMIVPFEGAGSVVTMGAGATDLRGILSMEGEWTPFTELSPEGLARAVWSSILSSYAATGNAAQALMTAGSGGVDYDSLWASMPTALKESLAAYVLAAAQADPIHSNMKQTNDEEIIGVGTEADKFRSHLIP